LRESIGTTLSPSPPGGGRTGAFAAGGILGFAAGGIAGFPAGGIAGFPAGGIAGLAAPGTFGFATPGGRVGFTPFGFPLSDWMLSAMTDIPNC